MKKRVYMTFDDGPSSTTEQLLEILKKHNVKACFFVTNRENRPDLLKKIAEEGHTIALHSYTHCYEEIYSSLENYFTDLKKIDDLVYETIGIRSKIVRLPGGSGNTIHNRYSPGIMPKIISELTKQGYRIIDWDIDNNDGVLIGLPEEAYLTYFQNSIRGIEEGVYLSHTRPEDVRSVLSVDMILEYCEKNGWETGNIESYNGPALIGSEANRKPVKPIPNKGTPYLMLVNKDHMIEILKMPRLKLVSYEDIKGIPVRIEKNTLIAFVKMKYYLAGRGIFIGIESAFRSVGEQKRIWDERMEQNGHNVEQTMAGVAQPWISEHHTGLAIDFNLMDEGWCPDGITSHNPDDERYRTVHNICHRFGFILRYPEGKRDITGFAYEPWHLRYVGIRYAREMHRLGLTLEEYTEFRKERDSQQTDDK